ncbi:MAG: DUF58 domain-containing protein [Phycisphaeraceae bacterium]
MTDAPNAAAYLDPHLLATVGPLDLRARMAVEGLMTGMHRSPMQGFSVEFAQHRPYAFGDDPRFLDWKVYARTDKLYLKQYQQETNLDMLLLIDASGSMGYGSGLHRTRGGGANQADRTRGATYQWRKFDHAATLVAAMSYVALRQQDRVGVVVFDDEIRAATRLSNTQGHWRTIVEALEQTRIAEHPDPATPPATLPAGDGTERASVFASLFDRVVARLTRRSLVVLVSDLFDDPDLLERGLARLQHRRHDAIIFQTLDPAERDFPFRSPSEFVGLEGEGRLPLDPAALRRHYLDAMQAHLDRVEQVARRFHFDHLLLDTAKPLAPPLSHFLAKRAAAIARS